MHATDANTDCLNCLTSVLMVIVQKQIFYVFFGCYFHGCCCRPFRYVITTNGDTLAARYEQTVARLEQKHRARYQVKVQWECAFDDAGIATPELLVHPTVCKSPQCTRDAQYGGRTEAMRVRYKAREGDTIQYVDVMNLYPFICKYGKFPVRHPVVHVGNEEACLGKQGLINCTIVPSERFIIPFCPSVPIRNSCSVFAEHVS
jgi:hypothetical protein